MTKIVVSLATVDGFDQTRTFTDLVRAREFATYHVGDTPEIGSRYAVAPDGVATIRVTGCTLAELFKGEEIADKTNLPFAVCAFIVNEDAGTARSYVAISFATYAEAIDFINSEEAYNDIQFHDGTEIVGQTDEARAELKAVRDAKWGEWLDEQGTRTVDYGDGIPF